MKKILGIAILGIWACVSSAPAVIPLPATMALPKNDSLGNLVAQLLRVEQTLYDGAVWYFPTIKEYPTGLLSTMRVFGWARLGGQVVANDDYYFPGLWANNANIAHLLADVGVPTTPTLSNAEIWNRMNLIWWWMSSHTSGAGDVYSTGVGFPSISDMALTYHQNGVIQHGACATTAQLMTTLMARAGIPVNRMAMAHAHYTNQQVGVAEHVFVILLMDDGWYYLDPTDCHTHNQLPTYANRASYGRDSLICDYTHPYIINRLPGSDLNWVPWCLDAD